MDSLGARNFVDQVFCREYGADRAASFPTYLASATGAVLGYRRAGDGPLFLEAYLDRPIEDFVGQAFGRDIARHAIIEIGNLASTNAMAMVDLWGAAANDLGASGEVVVATLTGSLRRMFRRIGIALHDLGTADPRGSAIGWRRLGQLLRAGPARLRRGNLTGAGGHRRLPRPPRARCRGMSQLLDAMHRMRARRPNGLRSTRLRGRPLTYAMLAARVDALAPQLADQFADRGVALELDHGADEVVLELALLDSRRAGAFAAGLLHFRSASPCPRSERGHGDAVRRGSGPTDCVPLTLRPAPRRNRADYLHLGFDRVAQGRVPCPPTISNGCRIGGRGGRHRTCRAASRAAAARHPAGNRRRAFRHDAGWRDLCLPAAGSRRAGRSLPARLRGDGRPALPSGKSPR